MFYSHTPHYNLVLTLRCFLSPLVQGTSGVSDQKSITRTLQGVMTQWSKRSTCIRQASPFNKALKQFLIIFLIKPMLNFNHFITIVAVSTHIEEKKIQYFTSTWIKRRTVLGHIKCIPVFSSVRPKKYNLFLIAWKHHILELYSV